MFSSSSCHRVLAALGVAAATVATVLTPTTARADTLDATRGRITEKTHTVDLVMRRGHAHMSVVREVHNHGERHDQAIFHLFLPEGAVATGLRTRGMQNGLPVWFLGELLDAEVAAARYVELTGLGGFYPKDPALLSWRAQGHLALQVFPCPPKEDKGIGYELDLPTSWTGGRDRALLPKMGLERSPATATLRTDVPGARLFLDGREVSNGTPLALDGVRTVELEPPPRFGEIGGRMAAVPFGSGKALVALRFEAPRQIAEVPRGAHVVIALDTSRSVAEDDLQASMRAANAHLAHYRDRDARVAVIGFDRQVRDLTKGFVSLDRAAELLDGAAPARANGSAVELAVARASQLLAGAPGSAPKRIVVLHDLLARRTLTPGQVPRPVGAVLHLAKVISGGEGTERDDADAWAALPRATGGLLFTAMAPAEPLSTSSDRASVEAAFLEWARPVRVDRMSWRAAGVEESLIAEAGDRLEEGASIEVRALQSKLPSAAVLEGELWSRPIKATLGPTANEGKLWSALVFGTELIHGLSEPEMKVLAFAGGAVSPMTSYLAIEPGVRPSTEGLTEGEGGGGRGVGIGLGSIGTIGRGGGGAGSPPDYAGIFQSLVKAGVERCGASGRARIDAESTREEVADVAASVEGDDAARTMGRCVEEAAWAVTLPAEFGEERMGLHVQL